MDSERWKGTRDERQEIEPRIEHRLNTDSVCVSSVFHPWLLVVLRVVFVCFRGSKPGKVCRERAQSAQKTSGSQPFPHDFQSVSIRSQTFPNVPKRFPNDSQTFPNPLHFLCTFSLTLNTCRFPREYRGIARQKNLHAKPRGNDRKMDDKKMPATPPTAPSPPALSRKARRTLAASGLGRCDAQNTQSEDS